MIDKKFKEKYINLDYKIENKIMKIRMINKKMYNAIDT